MTKIYLDFTSLRWAVKLYPLIPSSLLIDSLEIALRAREIDMRASPYDLKAYKEAKSFSVGGSGPNFSSEPIYVETPHVCLWIPYPCLTCFLS
jgi:hypothetical protein